MHTSAEWKILSRDVPETNKINYLPLTMQQDLAQTTSQRESVPEH